MNIIRISDIPQDELHLLPIVGLRQQIEEDRNRTVPKNHPTESPKRGVSQPDKLPHTMRRAAAPMTVAGAGFFTEWQMQDEPPPNSRLPVDRENADADKDFDDEEVDNGKDDDSDEDGDDRRHAGGRLATAP
jgi:hypothetical protein